MPVRTHSRAAMTSFTLPAWGNWKENRKHMPSVFSFYCSENTDAA
jgi:hypothetical protein